MRKLFLLTCALFLFVGAQAQLSGLKTSFNQDKLVGHWEFKSETDLLKATKGGDLAHVVTSPLMASYEEVDGYSTVKLAGGVVAKGGGGLSVAHGVTPGTKYCLMFDIFLPAAKRENTGNLSSLYWNTVYTDRKSTRLNSSY